MLRQPLPRFVRDECVRLGFSRFHLRPGVGHAFTVIECAIAVAILAIVAASAFATLGSLNKYAASNRIRTNAREIVQRNIEAATAAPFTIDTTPAILAKATNSVWDDDGGGDNAETIYLSRDGTSKVTGILYRTVTSEANDAGADIRRVNFRLSYSVYGRTQSYEMTTLRAMDK